MQVVPEIDDFIDDTKAVISSYFVVDPIGVRIRNSDNIFRTPQREVDAGRANAMEDTTYDVDVLCPSWYDTSRCM